MLAIIGEKYGHYVLLKALKKSRSRKVIPLDQVRNASILLSFHKEIETEARAIKTTFGQLLPDVAFQIYSYKNKTGKDEGPYSNLLLLNKQDLNWYGRPKSMKSAGVDLLIDLTLREDIPLKFITMLSNANIKAGREAKHLKEILDLSLKADTGRDSSYVLEQLIHYLKQININSNAA